MAVAAPEPQAMQLLLLLLPPLLLPGLLCGPGPASALPQPTSPPPTPQPTGDEESAPVTFPVEKALPFTPDKLPRHNRPLEASDMLKDSPDAVTVRHPRVKDPGTTHEADGTIQACSVPPDDGEDSDGLDWFDNFPNFTSACSIPKEWLSGNSTSRGQIHVCTIPRDWWDSRNASRALAQGGAVSKALLAELNDTSVSCVTPSDIVADNSTGAAAGGGANGSIPRAWLRDSEDNIYIYAIPREWLHRRGFSSSEAPPSSPTASDDHSQTPTAAPTPSSDAPHEATGSSSTAGPGPADGSEGTESTSPGPGLSPSPGAAPHASSEAPSPPPPPPPPAGAEKAQPRPDDAENEVGGRAAALAAAQQHAEHAHAGGGGGGGGAGRTAFLQPTESAAILASVFVAIALLGYVGLLLWRRMLEKRYGNREMLVNEDDDFDTSDMRHFEL